MPRFLPLALLALLLGVALPAAADPAPATDTSDTESQAKQPTKKTYKAPDTVIHGEVHEPQVTFITTRPRMNADGELEFEHHAVPALLANSLLPRGDG